MKGERFTEERITYALRQAEGGTPVAMCTGSWA
jgi:hypothetical protein